MIDFSTSIDSTTFTVEDRLSLFKQELDVLFSTSKFDVLGDPTLGNNIEQLIWKTSFNSDKIRSDISDAIKSSCFMNEFFEWNVTVQLYHGSIRDIAVIDVNITNTETGSQTIQYVFK